MRLASQGDRRLTVRELENDLGIPETSVGNFEQDFRNDSRVCEIHSEIAHDQAERPSL